jgi:hypothetical protein
MTGETENVTMEVPHVYVERTLAIIKPDAAHKSEEIEDIILRSGFTILCDENSMSFSTVVLYKSTLQDI